MDDEDFVMVVFVDVIELFSTLFDETPESTVLVFDNSSPLFVLIATDVDMVGMEWVIIGWSHVVNNKSQSDDHHQQNKMVCMREKREKSTKIS